MAASSPKINVADTATRDFLRNIFDQVKHNGKTVESLQIIAPPSMLSLLVSKYGQLLTTNPELAWSQIAKEISSTLISVATQYLVPINNVYYVTIPALEAAFYTLWPELKNQSPERITPKLAKTFYLFLANWADSSILRAAFIKQGFEEFIPPGPEISINEGPPLGVMILKGDPARHTPYMIRRLQQYPCGVKNFIDQNRKVISNKWHLYENMIRIQTEYPELGLVGSMPETRELKVGIPIDNGKIYIIRPIGHGMCMGKGVVAVSSIEEVQRVYQEHKKCPDIKMSIITDYFPQPPILPLLYQGRKMHLRMYFLVRPASDAAPFFTELWPRGRIITAKNPYITGEWSNPDIHDTHSSSTPYNLWFPEDLPDPSQRYLLYERMNQIATGLRMIIEPYAHTYPESRYGFHVFGLDILVDEYYNVILMEANDKPGMPNLGEPTPYTDNDVTKSFYIDGKYTFQDFIQDYFDWIYVHGIHPFYGGIVPSLKTFGLLYA